MHVWRCFLHHTHAICGEFQISCLWRHLKFLHMWSNFQFPHTCPIWKAEIPPHDNYIPWYSWQISGLLLQAQYVSTILDWGVRDKSRRVRLIHILCHIRLEDICRFHKSDYLISPPALCEQSTVLIIVCTICTFPRAFQMWRHYSRGGGVAIR